MTITTIMTEKSTPLIGRRTGKLYRLGDEISIMVDYVDLKTGEINFLPVQRRYHL